MIFALILTSFKVKLHFTKTYIVEQLIIENVKKSPRLANDLFPCGESGGMVDQACKSFDCTKSRKKKKRKTLSDLEYHV